MAFSVEQLPHLDLSEEQEVDLINYLDQTIFEMEAEHGPLVSRWEEEIEAYEAPPAPPRSTPWHGACRITIPVIASMVDTVFPRLHSTIYSATTIVTIEEWRPEVADHAKAWEDMLDWIMRNELDIMRVSDSWFMETIIHGTGVVKLYWERIEQQTITYDDNGKIDKTDKQVLRNQPVLVHVPNKDLLIPLSAVSIKEAPIVAHRMRMYERDLLIREDNGLYKNVRDRVLASEDSKIDSYDATRNEIADTTPSVPVPYTIYECWFDYDLEGDGVYQPLLATYHPLTRTLLRIQPNPYNHKRKPFREIIYFPRHDRFHGIGMATQLEQLQEEITALHRQRIDNGTVANTKMWTVLAGSRADQSFQGVAPSLKILVDSHDEIQSLDLGEINASAFENERLAMQYAQQRSGVSDFLSGMDIANKGRTTATQTVTALQEARTRFNWSLEQVRDAIADLAEMITDLYQQFGTDTQERFTTILGPEKGILVHELLTRNVEGYDNVTDALAIQVTASSASANKAVEQQNLLGLMQMVQQQTIQYEMPLIQLILQPDVPQPLKDYALERIEGSRALMRRLMETQDVRNHGEILGTTEALRRQNEATAAAAQPPVGAGPGGAPLPAGPPGMVGPGAGLPF